jgi:hypothetical protein
MTYETHAIELLQKTERFYDGTDRRKMKLAFKELIENTERTMLECAPFYIIVAKARSSLFSMVGM